MNVRLLLATVFLLTSAAFAADPAQIPDKSIATKKELLISDDFQSEAHDPRWHPVVETFTFEKGYLKGSQTREKEVPAADGKPAVPAHPAVFGLDIPTRDSVVETNIRFEGASVMDVEFDDRKFQGSHYGHLCRAQVRLNKVTILDERDGSQSNALIELRKDPVANKEAIRKLQADHTASFPVNLEAHHWYDLIVETVGNEMRVTIDGSPVADFKSPGIGHPTKSKIEIGVNGKDGWFGNFKVWNAVPAT